MPTTRKTNKRKSLKKSVLKVDSADKIPAMEKMIVNGSITVVLVYADWCGACKRFKKNIWNPMCNTPAIHQRVAVRDDMIRNTSLASAEFDYLPSLFVVDENGNMQSFKTPEGKLTNAMPTPQSLNDMKRIVNVPLMNTDVTTTAPAFNANMSAPTNINKPVSNFQNAAVEKTPDSEMQPELTPFTSRVISPEVERTPISEELPYNTQEPITMKPINRTVNNSNVRNGRAYIPTPMVAPQKGGRKRKTRKTIIPMPKKLLKGLSRLFNKSRSRK